VGLGGVGDYAEDFVAAVRPHFADVVEYRHGAPGDDSVADLRRHRAAIRKLVADAPGGRVLVHCELSGGAVVPFWSTANLPDTVPVTATIHDPPHPIWWPARTRFMAEHWLVNHAVHFPSRRLSHRVQRRWLRATTLFVLTASGARSIVAAYPRTHVVQVPHLVADRTLIRPPQERPLAVGLFGLVYRGKGFEQIGRLRELLPKEVGIRVAGRGTEELPRAEGIDIVGAIEGQAEDAFFDSVRAIAMPYGKRSTYGMGYPSSAVMAHAVAYGTPVICTDHGALGDSGEDQGVLVLRGLPDDPDEVAAAFGTAAQALVGDDIRLTAMGEQVGVQRTARSGPEVARLFSETWSELLERSG
jgi:hypothetical protein